MAAWMPSVQMDEGLVAFKTTFADETKGEGRILCGGWPHAREFIAQVDEDVNLRWVDAIRRRVGCAELKYRDAGRWRYRIETGLHGMMQETWQRTNIIITDSRPAMSEARDHLGCGIGRELLAQPFVHNIVAQVAAGQMLWETPLCRLAYLSNGVKPGLWLPSESDVLPEWADPWRWRRKLGNELKKVKLFVGRLTASYLELCDDDLFNDEIQRALTDCSAFGYRLDFGKLLLRFSSTRRVFDSGQDGILNQVAHVRKESLADLISRRGIALPVGFGAIEAHDSESSGPQGDAIQAADLAAGFAKEDHRRAGIAGILGRFRAVLYNGKVVR